MSSYNNTTRRFPAAFGGQRRGGGGYGGQREGRRPYQQEVAYPAPEKKEEKKDVNVTSELDFPSLGSGWAVSKPTQTVGLSSFATLANKWKNDDDEEAARIRFEKEQVEKKKLEESRYLTTSRILGKKYTQYEEEYDEDHEYDHYAELDHYEQMMSTKPSDEDGWATVER